MNTQKPWPARLTQSIAAEVRRHRAAQGMSAEQLSARCAELGADIPRNTIADLENGRRASLSVAELLMLAAALEVPPVLLLFPVGREETTEILPDYPAPTFRALQWFAGESAFPHPGRGDVLTTWQPRSGPAVPLVAYRSSDLAGTKEMDVLADAARWRDRAVAAATERERGAFEAAAEVQMEAAAEARSTGELMRTWAEEEGYLPPRPIRTHEVMTGPRPGPDRKPTS